MERIDPKLGRVIVISGPSGVGKTSLCQQLLRRHASKLCFSISATTRPMRDGEVDGRDYYFLSREEFEEQIRHGDFIEFAESYDNYYGSYRRPLEEAVRAGQYYLMDIDVQGAAQLQDRLKLIGVPASYFFIAPPSTDELLARLTRRRTEDRDALESRLAKVQFEMEQSDLYDAVIVNEDLERSLAKLEAMLGLSSSSAQD
ncbi:MAG: guanylate kinase [Planctomycetota bacterium]